jgi:hypothetical protein
MTSVIPKSPIPLPTTLAWFGGRTPREVVSAPRPQPDRRLAIVATWFCLLGFVEPATQYCRQRVYLPYCGAPSGFRCSCGAQLHGHDPGDEDATP